MSQTIGVGIIVKDEKESIGLCIKSVVDHVAQVVVVGQTDTSQETIDLIKSFPKVEYYNFGDWVNDFAVKRNFCFAKLKTDWLLWVDADDEVIHPEKLQELVDKSDEKTGGIWFTYDYARDEFGNAATLYERERLLRANLGWIWKGRLHETVSPLVECKYVRSDDVVIKHNHLRAGTERMGRNFGLLDIMYSEDPEDRRIWLYYGHQHFASGNWREASKWYLKFGCDDKAIPLERYQALCYASKALRNCRDEQAIEAAHMAMTLHPEYRDAYLELAQSYLIFGDVDKALHWAFISENKDLISEPPHLIFINPLDYTFNKWCMLAECYLKKGWYDKALALLNQAKQMRPIPEMDNNIRYVAEIGTRSKIMDSIKMLAVNLLNNKEILKLRQLMDSCPWWFRETPDYQQLKAGTEHYAKDIKTDAKLEEGTNRSVKVSLNKVVNIAELLNTLDKKFNKVTFECSMPDENTDQFRVLSLQDAEELIMSSPNRHVLNLRQEHDRVWGEYDKFIPKNIAIKMFLGQGLETWNPTTIADIGCGGSETSAAMLCKEWAKEGCLPLLYAMDNQVYDGVIYRGYNTYRPDSNPVHLFISSRVPEVFDTPINAKQKWLWLHDIHRWDRITPERVSELDAIVVLSKWHANFTKATYPFLKGCEVIDMDNMPLSYEDCVTPEKWFEDAHCSKLPKMVIIGDAIDTERFKDTTEKRIPNRFIWCSSPDRGLEQVLLLWPMIKRHLPDAELKIYYGWEYFDHALGFPGYRDYKERILLLLKQPGVEWCGRVGQKQLAQELMKADAMLYPPPHDFRETYGIAFIEAQAAGCLVFYRQNGALGETIGDRGIPLPLDASPETIVGTIVKTLCNPTQSDIIRDRAKKYALSRTWGGQAWKWMEVFKRLDGQDNSHQGGLT